MSVRMLPVELRREFAHSLYPMPHGRKLVLLAAGMMVLYLYSTIAYGPRDPGPLLVDSIELVLGVVATMASVNAAQRSSRRLSHRFWVLMACAWILWSIALAMIAYYEVFLQRKLTESWDSDAVLFIFMAPMAMALLLDPASEGKEFDWQTALDFLQIGILTVLAYVFYQHFELKTTGGLTLYGVWRLQTTRLAALVVAYFLRAALTRSALVRSLFTRMGACLFIYGTGESFYSYGEARWNITTGHWFDLGFTVPLFLVVLATATWEEPGGPEPASKPIPAVASRWLRQNYSVLFPLAVLLVAARFGTEQRTVASTAVVVSFLVSLARLSITQHHQRMAVASQLQAEAKYRALVESVPAVTYVANAGVGGGWTYVSPQLQHLLGYTPEEWLASPSYWINQIHPEDRDRVAAVDNSTREPGQRYDLEYRISRRDGEAVWVRDLATVFRESDGGPLIIQGLIMDIRERKQAERALQESEAQLAHAQAIAHVGNWSWDMSTNSVTWSAEMYRMNGMVPDQPLDATSVRARVHPEDISLWEKCVANAQSGRLFQPFEYRIVRPDHSQRILQALGCELEHDSTGALARMFGAVADITERKLAEQALREWKERYEAAVLASGQIIYDWEPHHDRVTLGGSLEQILGYSISEVTAHAWWVKIVHPEDRAAYLKEVENCVANRQPFHSKYRVRKKDGAYTHISDDGYFVLDGQGNIVRMVGFVADISERLLLEARSRQSQRLEAIGLLAGSIAHDFNNSLNIISGYAELLALQAKTSELQRGYALQIQEASKRAAELTSQLLAFSRRQVFSPSVVNLNDVISGLHPVLRHLLRENIELMIQPAPGLGSVNVDHTQIERVILNLASNARDAMPKGGRLLIATSNATVGAGRGMEHSMMPAGNYVVLTIQDNGVGMDEATVAHVFDPFFTTKAPGKGTGLGLASVYGIVNQSGGFIWVDSQLGMGTTFSIYLPRVHSASARSEPAAVSEVALEGDETIFLVEDEDSLRGMTRDYLRTLGYSVVDARNGAEALDLAGRYPLPIDLLITDVLMPGMSGREVAESLCTVRPGLKVIYVSGYPDDAIAQHGVLEPGINFIQKPFALTRLANKIREVLTLTEQP